MPEIEIVSLRPFRFSAPGIEPKPRTFILYRDEKGELRTLMVPKLISTVEDALEEVKRRA